MTIEFEEWALQDIRGSCKILKKHMTDGEFCRLGQLHETCDSIYVAAISGSGYYHMTTFADPGLALALLRIPKIIEMALERIDQKEKEIAEKESCSS